MPTSRIDGVHGCCDWFPNYNPNTEDDTLIMRLMNSNKPWFLCILAIVCSFMCGIITEREVIHDHGSYRGQVHFRNVSKEVDEADQWALSKATMETYRIAAMCQQAAHSVADTVDRIDHWIETGEDHIVCPDCSERPFDESKFIFPLSPSPDPIDLPRLAREQNELRGALTTMLSILSNSDIRAKSARKRMLESKDEDQWNSIHKGRKLVEIQL